ncbi:MAG: hypothetical protein Q9165_005557 [Trypethelium subeluteriae]
MPFRERLKKTFSRSSSSSQGETSSLHKPPTKNNNDPSVYQPGEKMPRPKYRAPVDKKHADHLAAFNFAAAWRRSSAASQYSPFGTRAPSRNASRRASREPGAGGSRRGSSGSLGRRSGSWSLRRRSAKGGSGSGVGGGGGVGVGGKEDGVERLLLLQQPQQPEVVREVVGEDGTPVAPGVTPKANEGKASPLLEKHATNATATDQPFTSEELMLAYQKSVASKRSNTKRSD